MNDSHYDFSKCKVCGNSADPKYAIAHGSIFVCCSCGLHYLDYLDPIDPESNLDQSGNTETPASYIEKQLQSNQERFNRHIKIVSTHVDLSHSRLLDIGGGGGLFLSLAEKKGAQVVGVELDQSRAEYARTKYKLTMHDIAIEDSFWDAKKGTFDALCMWDVIEHVNYPRQFIQRSAELLKTGGYLFLDTPTRNSLFYRLGEWSYAITAGQLPTFLNTMYSRKKFAHKQILAPSDIKNLFNASGLELVEMKTIHELSFPTRFYLQKMLKWEPLVAIGTPCANLAIKASRIRNKMIAIGRKKQDR